MDALSELLNNGAFWAFLGVFSTAYFTYKGLLIPYRDRQRKARGRVDVKNVSTFEELKAAIELLQTIAERKDAYHAKEVVRLLGRIKTLEDANDLLYTEIEHLKERLRKARINHET